jgi:hypothetical protein
LRAIAAFVGIGYLASPAMIGVGGLVESFHPTLKRL